ncbi:hypothetical protein B2G71_23335 [Novosphingobium sp. PC22D]|uniref:hypothetical protein n=1 Tax=Novosphingobium sp. PC22D TaxID=1962403 RepID=UPI000BF20CA9|nr:hypothetical protein [Novosphingobium sp. PC22D]PEQ10262.1 hypothetical protein B2G71_23335 [Novosphingobium sp. PC22D]
MAEEHITTVEGDAERAPATHTTIIREGESRSGGGAGVIMALVLLVAVVGGIYLFSQTSSSEAAKDNAIASAANEVGDAANSVGNAVDTATDKISKQ